MVTEQMTGAPRKRDEAVIDYCKQNGFESVLPFWEIYRDWIDDRAKVRTGVCCLIK